MASKKSMWKKPMTWAVLYAGGGLLTWALAAYGMKKNGVAGGGAPNFSKLALWPKYILPAAQVALGPPVTGVNPNLTTAMAGFRGFRGGCNCR